MEEVVIDLYLILVQVLELIVTLGMHVWCLVEHLLHCELGMIAEGFKAFLCSLGNLGSVVVERLPDMGAWADDLHIIEVVRWYVQVHRGDSGLIPSCHLLRGCGLERVMALELPAELL